MANMQRMDDGGQPGNDDDMDMIEPASPMMELDETIDYSLVYALHTFVANLEGQVCVLKGDSLELLDDSNSYWWLVKCIKTDEIGYIPAENVETPFERLARLNKIRNVQLASINAQDAEEGDRIPPPNRRGITFSENHEIFEDYDNDYYEEEEGGEFEEEEAEEAVVSPTEAQAAASTKPQRVQSLSIGQNFLKKLLGGGRNSLNRTKEKSPKSENALRNPKSPTNEKPISNFPTTPDPQEDSAPKKVLEPINVLRIYAGNVDLKATFKSVAISKDMVVGELLESSLKRFRVPGAIASEYYLSVLHLDSQERRLPESDNVFQMLDALRHKQLPGVSSKGPNGNARVVSPSVHMNDDKIIKVIINKKLNLFEKNYHLIRIFMQDESDVSGKIKTYKTIGINSNARVADIVDVGLKKFKLSNDPNFVYSLSSIFKGLEIARSPGESILDILVMAEGSPEDIDFILKKEWVGEGSMPRSVANGTSAIASIQDGSETVKPAFLEDLPMSPSNGSFVSGAAITDPNLNSNYSGRDARGNSGPLTREYGAVPEPGRNGERNSGQGVEGMTDGQVGSNSNSWLGGVLNSLEFNGGASSGSFQSGQISNASGPVGSGTSWSPPSPPDDNEMERARKLTQQSSSVEQYEEQGGEEKGSHVYWAGPPGVVPPRKGSLTDHSVPRRLLAEYANSHPEITEAEEAAMKAAEGLRSASADQTDAANGEKRASDISPGGNSNAAIKANFEYMEEYLEEIMKDDINPTKLEALETALRKNSVAEPGSGKNTPTNSTDSLGQYTDSGLSQILRSQRSQPDMRRPSADSTHSALTTPPQSASNSTPRNRSNSSNPVPTTRLRDMYDDIEKDLEKSMSVNSNPASRGKGPASGSESTFAPPTPPSSSPQTGSVMSQSRNARSDPNLTLNGKPVVPNIVTEKGGINKRSESDPSLVTPLSARIDPSDPMTAIERFREAELMLNAMQRDLDSLLASAVNAFQVTDTIYARS